MKKAVGITSKVIIFLCFELICISVIICGFQGKRTCVISGICMALFLGVLLWKLSEAVTIKNEKALICGLAVLCFFVKVFAVSFFTTVPVADYQTFYEVAQKLTEGYNLNYNPLYIALFPHVFGYAEFLSIFFKLFGSRVSVAVLLNVVLSVISMVFIYKIGRYLGGSKMAAACAVLWIVFPSQSLWNGFVLSEPLYTTELLAFWYLCLYLNREQKRKKVTIGLSVLAGVILSLFHMVRSIGLIVVIALLISVFLVNVEWVNKKRAVITGILICSFFLGNQLVNYHVESRIGTATGGFSWYNLCVGLEESSNGKWNQEDWDRVLGNVNQFQQAGVEKPAKKAQEVEKEVAIEKAGQIKHPWKLLQKKFKTLLGNDSSGIIIHLKYSQVELGEKAYKNIDYMTNSFYYMIVVLSMGAGVLFLTDNVKDGKCVGIDFIFLYTIGLTLGHMVLEVQERYHYSILIGFLMGAGYCLSLRIKRGR